MNIARLEEFCSLEKISLQKNFSLRRYHTFAISCIARTFISPTQPQLEKLISFLHNHNIDFFVLGKGSNVLFASVVDIPIVYYHPKEPQTVVLEQTKNSALVQADGHFSSARFAKFACQHHWQGAEFLFTIPGALSGAVVQNAGCYGGEIKDIIHGVHIIDEHGRRFVAKKDLELSYRTSVFKKHNWFIENIVFTLGAELPPLCKERMQDFRKRRNKTQPKGKTAGSVFRNPSAELKAWQVIQQIDLQAYKIGGAEFSSMHANFIVNKENAQSEDIYQLICLAQETAQKKLSIDLELEIVLVGF